MKRRALIAVIFAVQSLLLYRSVDATEMIELAITGSSGQMFAGDCYLVSKTGIQKRHRVKGEVPTRIWLPAKAVRCNLQKSSTKGEMSVAVIRNGVVDVSQKSRYPLRWVVVSSFGPWGEASGGTYAARPTLR